MKEIEERGKNRGNGMKLWDDKQNPRKELEEKEKEDRKKIFRCFKKSRASFAKQNEKPKKSKKIFIGYKNKA